MIKKYNVREKEEELKRRKRFTLTLETLNHCFSKCEIYRDIQRSELN